MKQTHRRLRDRFLWLLMTIVALCPAVCGQASRSSQDNLAIAREFLRSLYPDTLGKHYNLSVEGWLHYDQPNALFDRFELYVGEGAQYELKRPAGGCMGTPSPLPLPTPPEFGPPSPTPSQPPPPAAPAINTDPDCQPGPVHYKQVLSVHFDFNEQGRLFEFHILSPGFRQLDQRNSFAEFVLSHPELTYAELVRALKKAGAKYGPDDKEQFIKDLPIQKLERFLGKMQVISVNFQPLWPDRANADLWPLWDVKIRASKHGENLSYNLTFEQFEGELISLAIEKPQ
jgi:hypothetical protein